MFDHLSIGVADLDRAARFYEAALAPLGLVRLWTAPRAVGFGPPGFQGEAPFAVVADAGAMPPPRSGFHLAFSASAREQVDAFHAEGVAAGGTDEGPPGVRFNYNPGYYAAFLLDPDGHRVEAVVHERVEGRDAIAPVPSGA